MGKIKGWTKRDENPEYVAWENDEYGDYLEIIFINGKYRIVYGLINYQRPNQTGRPIFTKSFKTKSLATEFAINYMRSHNG